MTSDAPLPADQQLAQLRAWIASATGRTYTKSDKRRYAVLTYDGQDVLMTLEDAVAWIEDADVAYELSERWMTPAQYEKLPEFEGF